MDIPKIQRVVVKIGSNVLAKDGEVDSDYIAGLARQVAWLKREKGLSVVLVSSGAVGLGAEALGLSRKNKTLPEKQAAAAVGQSRLMHMYEKAFAKEGLLTAQILITQEDIRDRLRYINAKNTFHILLSQGVIPIVNENDTVAVDEIKFGDNDTLSAHVTHLIAADLLILLSTVDGLMDFAKNERVPEVCPVDAHIEAMVMMETSSMGVGGMQTKIEAAKMVNAAGEWLIIANGRTENILLRLFAGESLGTVFRPSKAKMKSRKRWIAFHRKVKGGIHVDKGAREALLHKGKSLLPIGIIGVEGAFQQGDVVAILCEKKEIARGLVNYDNRQLDEIKGQHTDTIRRHFPEGYYQEALHRDNMTLL